MPPKQDLTGRRFGKLVVLSETEKRADSGSVVWHCKCDCGGEADVSARRLIRGKVRSCGCLSNPPLKDYVGKRFGGLTVLAFEKKERKVYDNSTATITYWRCRCDCGNEVVVGQPEPQSGDTQSCGCLQKKRVQETLQLVDGSSVTLLERNKHIVRCDNKSGVPGVWQEKNGRWTARIAFKKKQYFLGRFIKKEDAIKARMRGEEMYEDFLTWYYSAERKKEQRTEVATEKSNAAKDGSEQ